MVHVKYASLVEFAVLVLFVEYWADEIDNEPEIKGMYMYMYVVDGVRGQRYGLMEVRRNT